MQSSLFSGSGPISLEQHAYNAIKVAIQCFHLKPGETLVENDLAGQLGTSKTPVREAFLRLEREGLIVKIPYRGYTVSEISLQAVEEIFAIRAVLEGLAARLAARDFSEQDLERVEEIINRHEKAASAGNLELASQSNRDFHELIRQRCGSRRLSLHLANLDDHLQRYRLLSNFQSGRLDKSVKEHRAVLEALCSRAVDAAEQAARMHIRSVAADLELQDLDQLLERLSAAHSGPRPCIE